MISLSKFVAGVALAASCIYLCSCTMPVRTGYDRRIGGYKPAPASETAASQE
jgi:lipoprotein Spr